MHYHHHHHHHHVSITLSIHQSLMADSTRYRHTKEPKRCIPQRETIHTNYIPPLSPPLCQPNSLPVPPAVRGGCKPSNQCIQHRYKQREACIKSKALVALLQQSNKGPPLGSIANTPQARALAQNVVPPPPHHLLVTERAVPTWLGVLNDSRPGCAPGGGSPKQLSEPPDGGHRPLLQPAGPRVQGDVRVPSLGGVSHQSVAWPHKNGQCIKQVLWCGGRCPRKTKTCNIAKNLLKASGPQTLRMCKVSNHGTPKGLIQCLCIGHLWVLGSHFRPPPDRAGPPVLLRYGAILLDRLYNSSSSTWVLIQPPEKPPTLLVT